MTANPDGWDDAADWGDQGRDPAPFRPRPQLQIGGGRRLVEVVCCPACQTPLVTREGPRKAGDSLSYWRCRECPATWKEPAAVGLTDRRAFLT